MVYRGIPDMEVEIPEAARKGTVRMSQNEKVIEE